MNPIVLNNSRTTGDKAKNLLKESIFLLCFAFIGETFHCKLRIANLVMVNLGKGSFSNEIVIIQLNLRHLLDLLLNIRLHLIYLNEFFIMLIFKNEKSFFFINLSKIFCLYAFSNNLKIRSFNYFTISKFFNIF